MNVLAQILLSVDGFLAEKETSIDGIIYPCRPLYIEYLYLYPKAFDAVADIVSEEMRKISPAIIFAIESAVLPLASLVANKMEKPISVIRKPTHRGHETGEPLLFVDTSLDGYKSKVCVIFDDAIWSGGSVSHAITQVLGAGFSIIKPYFIVDFDGFPAVGNHISNEASLYVRNRISLISYKELLDDAVSLGRISKDAYNRSLMLMS